MTAVPGCGPTRGMSHSPARGFSLIEVLAAMVIFSTGAVILFSWIGQTADRLGRVTLEQRRLFGDLTGLEYIRGLNPMQRPTGSVVINDVDVKWEAAPVGVESPVRFGAANGRYTVQLFQVRMTTQALRAEASTRSLVIAGWRERPGAGRSDSVDRLFSNDPVAKP